MTLPHLDETSSAAPGISPGVVKDDETLLRELFNPQHVKNGELLPAAIPVKDLLDRGFSVHRMQYVTEDFVKKLIEERLSKPRKDGPWTNEGVARFKALEVRQLSLREGQQAFVIIDTATDDNPGHASIYATAPEKGEAHARELRDLIRQLLESRIPIEDAFELEKPQ